MTSRGSVCFGCIAPNSHRDFQATYSASKRNSLIGCIPIALKDVATNDLSSLNLLYCPPAPENLSSGTVGEASVSLSWTAVANTSKYRVEHRLDGASDWTVDDDTITTATHTVEGLTCGSDYQFRVSAYGSGTVYAAEWSLPSAVLTETTAGCVTPLFDESSYGFPNRKRLSPRLFCVPL